MDKEQRELYEIVIKDDGKRLFRFGCLNDENRSELKNTYVRELPGIAFSAILKETVVAHSFMDIVEIFKHNYF